MGEGDRATCLTGERNDGRLPERGKQLLITEFLRPACPSTPDVVTAVEQGEEREDERNNEDGQPVDRKTRKSYATVTKKTLPDVEDLPNPIRVGSLTRVVIPQEAYEEKLETFSFALIGKVNFRFVSMDDIRCEVVASWRLKGNVNLSPLGKGFILFRFEKEGDMASIWRRGPIKVGGQIIRFQRWRPDFNINDTYSHTKLVWIRFPELPMEYWHERILLTMAKVAGRPVALDNKTLKATMGNYARVLVEMELNGVRVEEMQVERRQPGKETIFCFNQRIVYEDNMVRCFSCKKLGHHANQCRGKTVGKIAVEQPSHKVGGGHEAGRDDNLSQKERNMRSPTRMVDAANGNTSQISNEPNVEGYLKCQDLVVDLNGEEYFPTENIPHNAMAGVDPMGVGQRVDNTLDVDVLGSTRSSNPSENESQASGEESDHREGDIQVREPQTQREYSQMVRALRPRRKINYKPGGRGGRGGKSGRGQVWEGVENNLTELSQSCLVEGRVVIHHKEVEEIDMIMQRVEGSDRLGKHVSETEQNDEAAHYSASM
ncbi:uncharacterized protein LOC122061879 [Macadamia integrifolia]|uniref:uncharacterized protein LOC122061879 n=1 Tax=Macadamia integrifolia TaxID=60698 RepID=UPI001C5320FE|nr:uncharacterized protein LOC122061879 [Macadamia integrifolia]